MKVYLDNAATTPIHPKVRERIINFINSDFGNPSSIHQFGRSVRVQIEEARETIAQFINALPGEIYFTSGGTEANNFAIFGISRTEYKESGKNRIITDKTEHHAVLDSYNQLTKEGFNAIVNSALEDSSININDLITSIDDKTSLITVIHVNNETGITNDVKEISQKIIRDEIYLHCDAVQSFGKIPIDVNKLGVNSLCGSSHKIYGTKGTGFLYAKSGTPLSPILFGGGQERNRRGGTENTIGIIGFAEAVKIASVEMTHNLDTVKGLKQHLVDGLKSLDKAGIILNSTESTSPYVLSVTFSGDYYNNDAESLVMYLDINGIAASTGSACTSGTLKPSHVILSMGKSEKDASGTVRFSFNPQNTIEEINYTLDVIDKLIKKFRR